MPKLFPHGLCIALSIGAAFPSLAFAAVTDPSRVQLLGAVFSGVQTSAVMRPGLDKVEVFRLTVQSSSLGGQSLSRVSFENRITGPGTVANFDASWDRLWLSTTNGTVLDSTTFNGGTATFNGFNVGIGGLGGTVTLVVTARASLTARDGDLLDLRIPNASYVTISGGIDGGFPVDPAGSFAVNGMTSRQVTLTHIDTQSFGVGTKDNLAFNVLVPRNGYQNDELNRFAVVNLGTARAVSSGEGEIKEMVLWEDDGDGVFEPDGSSRDREIRDMAFTGDQWLASGLSESIGAGGQRFFVAVEIDDDAQGRTIQLALPSPPDIALTMLSSNDGLIDAGLANRTVHTITIIDRVTIGAGLIAGGSARPGQVGLPVMDLIATNKYSVTKELTGLTVTNSTLGPGTQPELDGEAEVLTLYDDTDDSRSLGAADQVLGTAFFVAGQAKFTGLSWKLSAGTTRHLLMTADASLMHARDGDVLGTKITQAADLEFADATALSGVFPVTSGNPWTIDGMIAKQIENRGAPAATLGPGDGPVLALDVVVPRNGYQDDALHLVTVTNEGTAQPSDLAELHLWSDGGDGSFDAGAGDDQDLGVLIDGGGKWTSAPLSVPVVATGARLFVSITAAAAVTDSATVQLALPQGGLEMASNNDGPIDDSIVNPEALILSDRALTAALSASPAAVVVGQNVTVSMTVRNISTEQVSAITPSALVLSGSAGMALVSGPAPSSTTLAPGEQADFVWSYDATAPGDVRFTGSAAGVGDVSAATRTTLPATSNMVEVFAQPGSLPLSVSTAMPLSVNRGQTGVVPAYFTFSSASEAPGPAARLTRLRFRLEAQGGAGIIPANLLSRVTLFSGATTYIDRSSLEASGAEVDLILATPVVVTRGNPITVALAFDVLGTTTVPNFRIVIPDSTYFVGEDVNTGAPVQLRLNGQPYPIRTGLARVVDEATELDVATVLSGATLAGQGQIGAPLMTTRLTNPGTTGVTSDVRVASLAVILRDAAGVPVFAPGNVLTRVRVHAGPQLIADELITVSADTLIDVTLSPLLAVPVNSPLDIVITGDLSPTAALGTYRLSLADPAFFDARDPNSGNAVTVVYMNPPLLGDSISIEAGADSLFALGVPQMPASIGVGASGVVAMHAILRHPGGADVAAVRLDSLIVRCVDEARNPLVPALYLDRMHLLWNGVEATSLDAPPASGNTMRLALPNRRITSGDSDTITLVLDFETTSPSTTFELTLNAPGIVATDANTGAPVTIVPEDGEEFPLQSGLTRLSAPARTLIADLDDLMPATLVADGAEVVAGTAILRNDAPAGSGTIIVDRMRFRASDAQLAPSLLGGGVERVRLYRGVTLWGETAVAPGDTGIIVTGAQLTLAPGIDQPIQVRFVPRANATVTSFRIGFAAADVGVVQPGNPLLQVAVLPPSGETFPQWTETASFSVASFEKSYTNFPNPFAAGREPTTFAYYLPNNGRVTLRIWTARGERVASVLDDAPRAAGLHQADAWDGRNGRGDVVTNGVYVAEIVVKPDGGGASQRLMRKVAVVR